MICATTLQRNIIMCNNALEIRFWLSNGRPQDALRARYKNCEPFNNFPLESSVSATMMCELPAQLLELAVILFFTRFGIYLQFCWVNHVNTKARYDPRNVFIFFVVAVGLLVFQMVNGREMRDVDQIKRDKNYKGQGNHTFHLHPEEDKRLKKLRVKLCKLDLICEVKASSQGTERAEVNV